jgi:hypothetical protein
MGSDCREWINLDGYLLVTRMGLVVKQEVSYYDQSLLGRAIRLTTLPLF